MEPENPAPSAQELAAELTDLRLRGLLHADTADTQNLVALATRWYAADAKQGKSQLLTTFIGDMTDAWAKDNPRDPEQFVRKCFFDTEGNVGNPTELKKALTKGLKWTEDQWDKGRPTRFLHFAKYLINKVEAAGSLSAAVEPAPQPEEHDATPLLSAALGDDLAATPSRSAWLAPQFLVVGALAVAALVIAGVLVLNRHKSTSSAPSGPVSTSSALLIGSAGGTTSSSSPEQVPAPVSSAAVGNAGSLSNSRSVVTVPTLATPTPTAQISVLPSSRSQVSLLPSQRPTFTFDSLGGTGSKVIQVYAGPGSLDVDREVTGTFQSGQTIRALCKANGRKVSSDPSAGEPARNSTTWIRIAGTPEVKQFATMVYGKMATAALAKLPTCPID